MENRKKKWYMFLIKGIILIILSVFVLINPEGALKTIAFYLGIGFFISGIILVIRGIPAIKGESKLNWSVLEGVFDLIVGFLLIVFPLSMASIIPFLFGLWAGINGILILIEAVSVAENRVEKLITGILISALAFVLLFKPLILGFTIMVTLGIILMLTGILNIILSVRMKTSSNSTIDTIISD